MEIIEHQIAGTKVAEIISDGLVIRTIDDGLDLIGNVYYSGFDKMILHKENITPDFFDLKNKMAGEILQKFSNYRMQLIVLGDFGDLTSKSIRDFIYESNNGRQVNFLATLDEALERFTQR